MQKRKDKIAEAADITSRNYAGGKRDFIESRNSALNGTGLHGQEAVSEVSRKASWRSRAKLRKRQKQEYIRSMQSEMFPPPSES